MVFFLRAAPSGRSALSGPDPSARGVPLCAVICCLLAASASGQWVEDNSRAMATATTVFSGDLFGWRAASLGDVDNDGVVDFAVTAPFHNLNMGRVYVRSGRDGSTLWHLTGTNTSDILGYELAVLDDRDGDGAREVVVSAPFSGDGGRVMVYSGSDGQLLQLFTSTPPHSLGTSLATGGDFDGDGVNDLAVGDIGAVGGEGRLFVYSGTDFSLIRRLTPAVVSAEFGCSAAFVGDVDGDQRDDLAVGNRDAPGSFSGRLEVFGFDGISRQHLYTIPAVSLSCSICGSHIDGGKDVNADGVPDLVVGEEILEQVRVFSGLDGSLLLLLTGAPGEDFGTGAALVDDLNQDGKAEVLVGASAAAGGAGRVVLHSGHDGLPLFTMTHQVAGTSFGRWVDVAEDLQGDGFPEFVVTASGQAFLMSRCDASWTLVGSGFPGTLGVPALALAQAPVLGSSIRLDAGNSAGTGTVGLLLVGTTGTERPASFGGTLWPEVTFTVLLPVAAGGASYPGTIPGDASLCGQELWLQLLEADPGAAKGISSTPTVRAFLGR